MIFTISRASDEFMDCELPNPKFSPHERARWDDTCDDWTIDVRSVEDLVDLCDGRGLRLVIRKIGSISHVELDDVTNQHH